MFYLAQQPPVG